jgi:hypothetical protein
VVERNFSANRILIVTTLIILAFAVGSNAQIYDNILWTTNGVPVSTAADTQYYHMITTDGAGGAIIAWADRRPDDDTDIYAQRVDADGNVQWTADGMPVCNDSGYTHYPSMISDGAGGAVIAWWDYQPAADHWDIYAQRLNGSGTALWDSGGQAICTWDSSQTGPLMCSDGQGGFYFAWVDARYGYDDHDIYAQRVDADGNLEWMPAGASVCSEYEDQDEHRVIADGAGNAIIAWLDQRDSLDYDIYAQKIDADSYSLWTFNGTAVCNDPSIQYGMEMTTDGAGGAIIAWQDDRMISHTNIYAQRIDSSGTAVWKTDGVPICTAADDQASPLICSDQQGGAIIAWRDERSGDTFSRIYVQRVDAFGTRLWQTNGIPMVKDSLQSQYVLDLASDGSGGAFICLQTDAIRLQRIDTYGDTLMPAKGIPIAGPDAYAYFDAYIVSDEPGVAIAAWRQWELATDLDIYAQKINLNPQPLILSVEDIGQDQGRQVSLSWERSYLDDPWDEWITMYSIWRKYPSSAKAADMGREWNAGFPWDDDGKIYRLTDRPDSSGRETKEAWEYIGYLNAHHLDQYAFTAPTLEDSSGSGAPYHTYMVSAHTADPQVFYDSAPDSGYSVDDIGPAPTVLSLAHGAKGGVTSSPTIAHRSGRAAKGSLNLSWDQVTAGEDGSPEQGPITYHLHADTTAHFPPGPATLITATAELSYQHADARIGDPTTDLFYQVIVTDGSGNASAGSNRTGETDWGLASTTGTDYAWLALALDDSALVMASDLEAAIEAHSTPAVNCLTVSQWNAASQTYTHYTTVPVPTGDFALAQGLPCRVETDSAAVFTLVGAVPAAGSLSFQLQSTTWTDYTWITLPLELDTLDMASDLEAHIESHSNPVTGCLTVSQWNAASQTYTHYTTVPVPMGDFAIRPGRPYRVEVTASALWPYAGKGLRQFHRTLRTR